MLVGIVGDWCC